MDHEAICDCPFMEECSTFNDRLISQAQKGPEGMGCVDQNDVYRSKHCKSFSCKYLSVMLSDMLHPAAR